MAWQQTCIGLTVPILSSSLLWSPDQQQKLNGRLKSRFKREGPTKTTYKMVSIMLQPIFIRKYVYQNMYTYICIQYHSFIFIPIPPLSERHFVRVVGFMQSLRFSWWPLIEIVYSISSLHLKSISLFFGNDMVQPFAHPRPSVSGVLPPGTDRKWGEYLEDDKLKTLKQHVLAESPTLYMESPWRVP